MNKYRYLGLPELLCHKVAISWCSVRPDVPLPLGMHIPVGLRPPCSMVTHVGVHLLPEACRFSLPVSNLRHVLFYPSNHFKRSMYKKKEEKPLAYWMTRRSIKSSSQHLPCPKVTKEKEPVPSGVLRLLFNLLLSNKSSLQNETQLNQWKLCH